MVRFSPRGFRRVSGLLSRSRGQVSLRPARFVSPKARGRVRHGRHGRVGRRRAPPGTEGRARRVSDGAANRGSTDAANQRRVRNRIRPITGQDRGGTRQRGIPRRRTPARRRTEGGGPARHRRRRRRRSTVHPAQGLPQIAKGAQAEQGEGHRRARSGTRDRAASGTRGRRGDVLLSGRAVGGDGGRRGDPGGGARTLERGERGVGTVEK